MNYAPIAARQTRSSDETVMPSVLEALHCLRIAITIFDSSERLVFANEHFSHLFKSLPPRSELIGRRNEDLMRLAIAGGEIAEPAIIADMAGFFAEKRAQFVRADAQPFDISVTGGRIIEVKARRTSSGGMVALWTDVTEARHILGRLQNAIELSVDAFAFFDRKDKLVLCNDEFAGIISVNKPEDLTGLKFPALMDKAAALGQIVMSGGPEKWIAQRLQIHREEAGAAMLETAGGTAYLERDRATNDGGRVVVLTDVTEHTRIEKALAEQTRALDMTRRALAKSKARTTRQADYLCDLARKLDRASADADTTKNTLLRTMSHELKTPLNAIIGFSDLMLVTADRLGPEQVSEYAGLIHQGGKNLLRLLNQILDLTKISAGRYELRRVSIDAATALWRVKDALESKAAAKNIRIDTCACQPGLTLNADESAFEAMAHHLIENAVNFSQDGALVRLGVFAEGGWIKVQVSDNGPGVAPDDLMRILQPFEQVGRGTTDHAAGAGLGLTLVKAFCELHGGTLTVESKPGEGFTATIALPAAD